MMKKYILNIDNDVILLTAIILSNGELFFYWKKAMRLLKMSKGVCNVFVRRLACGQDTP